MVKKTANRKSSMKMVDAIVGREAKTLRFLEEEHLDGYRVAQIKFYNKSHEPDLLQLSGWKNLAKIGRTKPTYVFAAPSGRWYVVRFSGNPIKNTIKRLPYVADFLGDPVNPGVFSRAALARSANVSVEPPVAEISLRGMGRKAHVTEYVGEHKQPFIKNRLSSFLKLNANHHERESAMRSVARTMAQAHNAGVVHKDLHADNVLYFPKSGTSVLVDLERLKRYSPGSRPLRNAARAEAMDFFNDALYHIEKIGSSSSESGQLRQAFEQEYARYRRHK